MSDKTILLLSKFAPICGQVSTLNLWLARALCSAGFKIVVCSDSRFETKRRVSFGDDWWGATGADVLKDVAVIEARHIAETEFLPFSELSFLSYLASANEAFEQHTPDLIFSHYLEPYSLAGHFLSSKWDVPHMVTHAGSDIGRLCRVPAVLKVMQHVLGKADGFIAKNRTAASISQETSLRPSPYFPDPTIFRRNVATSALKLRGLSFSNGPILGFYGKFVHGKQLELVLDSFQQLTLAKPNARMIFVGGDIGGDFCLSDRISERGMEDHISTVGYLPNWLIPDFINSCDLMVYMKAGYRTDSHSSIVLRELIACNAKVLTTTESVRGLPEQLRQAKNVYLVEENARPAMIASTLQIALDAKITDFESREELLATGHQAFSDSWIKIALSILEGRS